MVSRQLAVAGPDKEKLESKGIPKPRERAKVTLS